MATALSCHSPQLRRYRVRVDLTAAFPGALAADVRRVLTTVSPHRLGPTGPRSAIVAGQELTIPYRIYDDPPEPTFDLSPTQRLVLHCLFSRHHDGYLRQRHLEALLWSRQPWVLPYLFLPLGEYVVEIVLLLRAALSDVDMYDFGPFVAENPELFAVTRQRAASYWAEYNRRKYPKLRDYPAMVLLESMRRAGGPAHRPST